MFGGWRVVLGLVEVVLGLREGGFGLVWGGIWGMVLGFCGWYRVGEGRTGWVRGSVSRVLGLGGLCWGKRGWIWGLGVVLGLRGSVLGSSG